MSGQGMVPYSGMNSPSVPTPNIPGASSVTPYGPPTYSNTPNSTSGALPYNPQLPSNGSFNPNALPPGQQVMPNQPIMPNSPTPGTGLGDPDATRVPGFGGSAASLNPSNEVKPDLQRIPMVAIDRSKSDSASTLSIVNAPTIPSTLPSTLPSILPSTLNEPMQVNREANESDRSPSWQFSGVQPLTAPQNFDSKPKWNPTLLDPEDRTVMERSGQLMPSRSIANGKIELRDEDSSVVSAVASNQRNGSDKIQLVSGIESVKTTLSQPSFPGFRPVSSLK